MTIPQGGTSERLCDYGCLCEYVCYKAPVHGVDADCVFLDGQMIAKDLINLTLVPAAFPVCLPEDITTACSAVYLYCCTSMCLWRLCHV